MIYRTDKLLDDELINKTKVLILCGNETSTLFYDIANDKLWDTCKGLYDIRDISSKELMEEFGVPTDDIDEQEEPQNNKLTFEMFQKTIHSHCLNGYWYSVVQYDNLNEQQRKWLFEYMKDPSDNGKLLIHTSQYKNYAKRILNNNLIKLSETVNVIQTSFPEWSSLKAIIKAMFYERGLIITDKSADTFRTRMNKKYDKYKDTVERVSKSFGFSGIVEHKILYPDDKKLKGIVANTLIQLKESNDLKFIVVDDKDFLNNIKGIEEFVIDNFVDRILIPLEDDKCSNRRKVYKVLGQMLNEYGAEELVKRLRGLIDLLIEFRLQINKGNIPILVKYSIPEAKERIGKDNRIYEISDFKFEKYAELASRTTIKDWIYMKMILMNTEKYGENIEYSYEKVLFTLINRAVITEDRLQNDVGAMYSLDLDTRELNSINYDSAISYNKERKEDTG